MKQYIDAIFSSAVNIKNVKPIQSSNLNPISVTLHQQEHLMETFCPEKKMSTFSLQET